MKHITSEDIYKAATLKQESPIDRNFDKWHAYIELKAILMLYLLLPEIIMDLPLEITCNLSVRILVMRGSISLASRNRTWKGFFMFGDL